MLEKYKLIIKNKGKEGFTIQEFYEFDIIPTLEVFYSEDTNWGVYKFMTDNGEIPYIEKKSLVNNNSPWNEDIENFSELKYFGELCGKTQRLYIGNKYTVKVKIIHNEKYKRWQYEPISVLANVPKTIEQQKIFIRTFLTEKQSNELLREYPNIVEEVIADKDNVDVTKLNGIGEYTWSNIRDKIIENFAISDIVIMLQPYGISYKKIKRLLAYEPNVDLLKKKIDNNPYILTKVRGFGFITVDDIALKLKPELKDSKYRLKSFLYYYFNELANNKGDNWVKISYLDAEIERVVPECYDLYKKIIDNQKEKETFLHFDKNKKYVGLLSSYATEKNIIDILTELDKVDVKNIDYDDSVIKKSEVEQGFDYTDEQKDIIKNSLKSNISIIAGKAGVGKSTIARGILNCYSNKNLKIGCCALSAKAAQRLSESTGREAKTIHRMLGYNGSNFTYNSSNPLTYDVVFIDEASMINQNIFYDLIVAIPMGCKVIICGDDKQLPPIGSGNIFHDILQLDYMFNINRLNNVLRQAKESGILMDANMLREAITPIKIPEFKITHGKNNDMIYMFRNNKEQIFKLAYNEYLEAIEEVGLDNVLLVVPRRQNCVNCSVTYNNYIQRKLLHLPDEDSIKHYGSYELIEGTKIIQRKNDSSRNIYNGEIGYITKTNVSDGKFVSFTAVFNDPITKQDKTITYAKDQMGDVELAYAMTAHLSQGSGYDTVIVVIDNSSYVLLDNCLLYTAITRAKKKCILISEPSAFKRCVTHNLGDRDTWLSLIKNNKGVKQNNG